MEKKILQYSYWLGLLCGVIAVIWRAANAAGFFLGNVVPGVTIYYQSFFKGAVLFLLTAVATEAYMAGKRQ
ncbi:MAG TPA: hypothetical protein VGQ11_05870 [Candidatus Acidoferrales bacterium]|jgi:hypothetical protein|nr:hypothetical protein [Candidatus Acidoferrales bacterium]